jgi:hypothetical protein
VADVLTDPFAVAAVVMVVAGVAKLRAPAIAVRALREIGLPAGSALVRGVAGLEVGLGVWCLLEPGAFRAIALACCYAAFAALALMLARRRAACGCFGEGDVPASGFQALISAVLAAVCAAAALWSPHDLGWLSHRPAGFVAVLVIGIAGSAYATVLAYTQLPAAWSAWSAR